MWRDVYKRQHKGFRLCGGDQGAFRSPPGPLRGPLFLVDGQNLQQETNFLRKAGNGSTFLSTHHKGFRLCGGDQGAFRSPPGPLRGPSRYAWVKSSTRNNFLAEGRKRACPNPSHKCKQPLWTFLPPWPYCIYYIFSRTTLTSSCPAGIGISWAVSNSYPSGTCSTCIT